ncbi:gephyrin-like molybdotransferase receptor GlpR [Amycolatopsis jejuensis]|uniref:divisome protein SepX/GlpR n=1 Tax=Amycolatopsis jejuensis TaxID=330084 RepID=UPI00052642C7|nr:gephyrin-like molybdotransferase receptor GlpR [Amycolatopsis jejuensis]
MPSSVIIVALAAAWLVVLVPMVARKRQQVARTPTSALAARVVRRGSARNEGQEERAVPENAKPTVEDDLAELEAELDADLDEEPEPEPEPLPQPARAERGEPAREHRSYRPGRGGFDPEAAEIAARAKYAFRQRVVVILLIAAVVTAAVAGFLFTLVWWAHAAIDLALIGYLFYLRRQVRIENDIRQRRMARYSTTRRSEPVESAGSSSASASASAEDDDVEVVAPEVPREIVERKPSPMSRIRRQAVVVDLDDEDPAFEELDEPTVGPYRRAVGE